MVNISDPRNPIGVSSRVDGESDGAGGVFDEYRGATGITTVKIDGFMYALVATILDDGVQIINISNPARPTAVSSVTENGNDGAGGTFDELDGASDIATVTIGESTYALVASFSDNGVQIIDISIPAAPTAVFSINDGQDDGTGTNTTFDALRGAIDITTVKIGEST